MASRLLRNIAVRIGAGLAAGFGRPLASRQARRSTPNLHPFLSRLEEIESRVTLVEDAPAPQFSSAPEEIAALGTLVSSQSEDIAALRQDIQRIERRNAEQIEAFGQKVALLEQQVPAHIETSVNARMAELEQRLRGEFREIHYRTVDAFAETIESRVVGRITALENSLIEQSHSIVSLREKSLKTDDNLTRLLEAVEKLCVRAEVQSQISLLQLDAKVEAPTPQSSGSGAAKAEMPPPSQPGEHLAQKVAAPELSEANPAVGQGTPQPIARQSDPEPEYVSAGIGQPPPSPQPDPLPRHGFKPVGVAILGLALLGFRLMR